MTLLRLLSMVAIAAAATIPAPAQDNQVVSTFPMDHVPSWQEDLAMTLSISAPGGGPSLDFPVVPFTRDAGFTASQMQGGSVRFKGQMIVATHQTYADLTYSGAIAYLCCDPQNNSKVTPDAILSRVIENHPKAILLYSQEGNCCGVSGLGRNSSYQRLFTMMDSIEASATLNASTSANGILKAVIQGNVTQSEAQDVGQNGNNSAVAMSVLYSITGLITLLFLVIIVTGAIRAHRYPERYGPRNGHGGRPGQSRAKGIARAVLDTLPIVKFGAPQPTQGKPDPALELEDGEPEHPRKGFTTDHVQAHHLSTIPEDAEAIPTRHNYPMTESRVAPAQPPHTPAAVLAESQAEPLGEEHLGCSICTEDFLVGEDVRVLPCDHKFHPPCIDPWLVNVSGTCPLCRLDLHPPKSIDDDDDDDGDSAQLPPPLGADPGFEGSARGANRENQRHLRFFDLSRLRHASTEERIEVLRRYRTESREGLPSHADAEEERSRTSQLSARLRERFRVLTRVQPPGLRRQRPTSHGPGQNL